MNGLGFRFSTAMAALCLTVGFSSCNVSTPQARSEGELGKAFKSVIPGTWTEVRARGGYEARLEKTFNADGTAHGTLDGRVRRGGLSIVMPRTPFHSKWRVRGDVTECFDIVTADPDLFPKGTVIHDQLLGVSADRIDYRDMETGEKTALVRKH